MATVVTRDVLAKKLADRAEITIAAARDEVSWFFDSISSSLEKGDEHSNHKGSDLVNSKRDTLSLVFV